MSKEAKKRAKDYLKKGAIIRAKLTTAEIEELIFLLEKFTEVASGGLHEEIRKELIHTFKKKLNYSKGNSAKWTYLPDTFTK